MDAETGRTLWRRVFADKGINWNMFNKGGPGLTPYVADGRVYAMGTLGRVYCLDARTGEPVWESNIGTRYQEMEKLKAKCLRDTWGPRFNRDFLSSVLVVDGVVVCNTHVRYKTIEGESTGWVYHYERPNGLVGLDARTGRRLWTAAEGAGMSSVPLRSGSAAFVIGSGGVCIHAKTGRVAWRTSPPHKAKWSPVAHGEYLLINPERDAKRTSPVACYRISPAGAKRLWQLGEQYGSPPTGALIHEGRVYVQSKNAKSLICADLATGKVLATTPFGAAGSVEHDNAFFVGAGKRIFTSNGRDVTGFNMFNADPNAFRQLGGLLKSPVAVGYVVSILPAFADGRMFVRTNDRIVCYDLRR
jgi:outer membrane protein assembly factor BamB